jgi:hypothetical protein
MSDTNIENMNFKQLRNEVQLLRDELAMFQRSYEDMIYNLDSDNFGKGFTIEQNRMRSQLKVTAEAITLMVSSEDLDEALKKYSTIEMTDSSIKSVVSAEYINTKIGDTYVDKATLKSELEITESGIFAVVSENYDDLDTRISSVSVSAEGVVSRVENLETFKSSTFTQSADEGFTLDGVKVKATGYISLTDNNGVEKFSISHAESQLEGPRVMLHSLTSDYAPLVLGDKDGQVYISSPIKGNEVATRSWVEANAGSSDVPYAVFG